MRQAPARNLPPLLWRPMVFFKKVRCMMDAEQRLEERVAHLIRAVEDMSDVVTRQGKELDRLTRLVRLLAEREAEREQMAGDAPAANQRPPHW